MKADFNKVPEGNAWHRGLQYIQISEILYDVINPCCGIEWQIVSANKIQENICGYNERKVYNSCSPFQEHEAWFCMKE